MSDLGPEHQGWHNVDAVDQASFSEARRQMHWAAQILGAIGDTHADQLPNDGQQNTGWVDGMQLLAGRYLDAEPTGFFSLTPNALLISYHEPGGEPLDYLQLDGQTVNEVKDWVQKTTARRINQDVVELALPNHGPPADHLTGEETFGGLQSEALEQLHRWIHNSNLVLRDLRARHLNVTMPRLWPHRLDMSMTITLDESHVLEVGLGLGDQYSPQPFWYVSPGSTSSEIPQIDLPHGGRWVTTGLVGAKLEAASVIGDGQDQEARSREFVDVAVAACAELASSQ